MNKFGNRIVFILTLGLIYPLMSLSQIKEYYFYSQLQISNNKMKGVHESYGYIEINENARSFVIGNAKNINDMISISSLYVGRIIHDRQMLICIDKFSKKRIVFKELNGNTIEALQNTSVFRKGRRLYLAKMDNGNSEYTSFLHENDLINSLYWENGVKEGIHCFYNKNQIKLVYYIDDLAIDSVICIDRFQPEIDLFVKKYRK